MEWKNITYDPDLESSIIRINEKKDQLNALRPLPAIVIQKIKESLTIEWTYNSNSIEGNTLSLNETQIILETGITVKGKTLREHFEVVNHQDAIDHIEKLAKPNYKLSSGDICDVHKFVLDRIEKDYAGRIRSSGVRITGANFTPPNARLVPEYLDDLVNWCNTSNLDVIIKSAIFHHRFVWIHPFFDGNGRTVRLIFNLLLMSEGFPPAIILRTDRKKYYDALNQANKGNYSKVILLVIQSLERSLDIYLGHLNNTYDDFQSIQNIVQDPEIPYGQEYVSLLARNGKISAFKEGRNWLTSKKAVLEYIESKKSL